jgi:hypothetical protein
MVIGKGEDPLWRRRIRLQDFYDGSEVVTDELTFQTVGDLRRRFSNLDAGEIYEVLVRQGYRPPDGGEFSERVVASIVFAIGQLPRQ